MSYDSDDCLVGETTSLLNSPAMSDMTAEVYESASTQPRFNSRIVDTNTVQPASSVSICELAH